MSKNNKEQNTPDGWQTKQLGDLGRISMCKRILKSQTSENGDIPFFKIGTFGKEPDAYITKEVYEDFKTKYSFPKKGDILISASGTIGRAVVYDGRPAYYQDSNIIWIANNENTVINPYLRFLYDKVQWQTASGTIARLYNDNVRRIEIVAPEIPEQKRIVKVLETWDEAIEKLGNMIALKREVKKGLMQKLLTGELRLPGFKGEWVSLPLNEVGSTFSGLTGKTKEDFGQGSAHYVSYMNVFANSKVDTSKFERVEVKIEEKQNSLLYGDVIFTTSSETPNEVGMSSVYLAQDSSKPIYLNSFCFGFRLNQEKIAPQFARYLFRDQNFRKEMTRIAQGASRYNLSKKYFLKTEVKLPNDKEEQLAIAKVIENSDLIIKSLQKERDLLQDQKKYLLNNLVTGQIRTPENL